MPANTQEMGLFQMLDQGILHPNQDSSTVDSGLMISGINYDLAQHNADIDAILGLFCETTTDFQQEVQQTGASRSQPVDEFGRAIPQKPIAPYTVGFPIQGSGNAMGETYLARNLMTVGDVSRTLQRMLRGDAVWVRDHVLACLFDNAGYSFRDPLGHGDLAVKGLANDDAVKYYKAPSASEATDDHYLAQAAAIADAANPFTAAKAALKEHPDNGGSYVSFISTTLVATTEALADFHTADLDPDVTLGADQSSLTGTLGITLPATAEVKGKSDGVWVVEWPILPAGYIITVPTEGPRAAKRRQFPQANLQGFKSQGERSDFPYFDSQWQRWEGYGAHNRVGATVTLVGNANYSAPNGYATMMP